MQICKVTTLSSDLQFVNGIQFSSAFKLKMLRNVVVKPHCTKSYLESESRTAKTRDR